MVEMKDVALEPTDAEMKEFRKPNPEIMDPEKDPKLKKLIDLDEKYMTLESEYSVEWAKLQQKYETLQKPLLEAREKEVNDRRDVLPGFWLKVLEAHPVFAEEIQAWDKPVLEKVSNIRVENLPDPSQKQQAGFKLVFEFFENEEMPFTNKTLTRIFETGPESEYLTEVTIKGIKMDEDIEWKAGEDITIEMKKSDKKKNAKKGGAPKITKEPRVSFFRTFFRSIELETPDTLKDLLDKALHEMGFDANEAEDEDELEQAYEDALEKVSDDAYEMGLCLRDNIIPFAVRWYTGQACPMDDDDDMEDGGDDQDDGDEDSSDDEEGEKPDIKGVFSDDKKPGLFDKPSGGEKDGEKKEECKQQ